MDPQWEKVSSHMLQLGLGALQHSNWHSNYMSWENETWPELSVLQAAHAAEILIKARIAQEHPLLVFEQVPSARKAGGRPLGLDHLLEHGRTYQWSDLPDRLWATTGIELPRVDRFFQFGRIRNQIQHFAAPGLDLSRETIEFTFEVIDPFIHECWSLFAIDYNEDHEPYVYLMQSLVSRGIPFLVSREATEHLKHAHFEWPNEDYRRQMELRFTAASTEEQG